MTKAIKEVINMSKEALIVLLAIFIIIRVVMYFCSDSRRFSLHEEIMNLLFLAYLLVLALLVTSDSGVDGGTNFIPFKEILRYDVKSVGFQKQVIGNILLFMPFGFFVSKYGNIKNLGTITLASLLSSLSIELVQYFVVSSRSFDIDDIILNVVGGILGFLIFISLNAINNHMPKFLRRDWFYNVLSILIVILIAFYVIKVA